MLFDIKGVVSISARLLSTISHLGKTRPDDVALTFIGANDVHSPLTYGSLYNRSRIYAHSLRQHCQAGDRCLLCLQPSNDFIISFIGSLYAGCIPIPAYPPFATAQSLLLTQFAEMTQSKCIIVDKHVFSITRFLKAIAPFVNQKMLNLINKLMPLHFTKALLSYPSYCFDRLSGGEYMMEEHPQESDLAYIQFSSGTTNKPKGVMVQYQNVVENVQAIHEKFKANSKSTGYIWIPPFHDMGLVGGILYPLLYGFHTYLTSPLSFIKNQIGRASCRERV